MYPWTSLFSPKFICYFSQIYLLFSSIYLLFFLKFSVTKMINVAWDSKVSKIEKYFDSNNFFSVSENFPAIKKSFSHDPKNYFPGMRKTILLRSKKWFLKIWKIIFSRSGKIYYLAIRKLFSHDSKKIFSRDPKKYFLGIIFYWVDTLFRIAIKLILEQAVFRLG